MASPLIAIVGRGAVLPGALHPDELWTAVAAGRDLVKPSPIDRWGVAESEILGSGPDQTQSARGGYVEGFEDRFSAARASLPLREGPLLEPVGDVATRWMIYAAGQALAEAGASGHERVSAFVGNLSFPSQGMSRYAESVWLAQTPAARLVPPVHPRDRFHSALPLRALRDVLGVGGRLVALDAACASALYAVALAAEDLLSGACDLALAGAINRADDLFLHVGFSALSALSPSGRSRPFHREADGLLPAEGAVLLVLKRLEDAVRAGDRVFGVLQGWGLSNDGRGRGMLAPSSAGQERALRAAWRGQDPTRVGLVECHATGTKVGDATELETLARVFAGAQDLPIGSLKSNLGHLITAAGGAALLKVLGALHHHLRPPTLHVDDPNPAVKAPFRLLTQLETWASRDQRIAAVDAFGFGGNNAHVVVAEPDPRPVVGAAPRAAATPEPLAVVALGARVGSAPTTAAFADWLLDRARASTRTEGVDLPLRALKTPPKDLGAALGQQTLLLAAAIEALDGLPQVAPERCAIWVGLMADPEVCRYGARWRLGAQRAAWGEAAQRPDWLGAARDAIMPPLSSAGVLGTMPNIPANRLNVQFDAGGPSYVVHADEASGLEALRLAGEALRRGEIDRAVVGAVDLSHQEVHQQALAATGRVAPPGDGAVLLVLERLADTRRAGRRCLAVLDGEAPGGGAPHYGNTPGALDLRARVGEPFAAIGLLGVAAAVVGAAARALPRPDGPPAPWPEQGVSAGWSTVLGVFPPIHVSRPSAELAMSLDDLAKGPNPSGGAAPHLSLSAHAPPPVWPTSPAARTSLGGLPPAPRDDERRSPIDFHDAEAAAPAAALVLAAPAPAAAASVAPAPAAAPRPRPAGQGAAIAALLQGASEVHQRWLEQQLEAHQAFLQVRSRFPWNLPARPSVEAAPPPAPAPSPAAPVAEVKPSPLAAPAPVPVKPLAPPAPAASAPPRPAPAAPVAPKAAPSAPQVLASASKPASSAPRKDAFPTPEVLPVWRAAELPGPKYGRRELEILASGKISEVFGDLFARQDGFRRQVRMPEPPLLLAEEVLGIDAAPGTGNQGTLWTQTRVRPDDWFLHDGAMPAGILIETGQADLLLISWLGADFQNQGERVYRLLGCELTYYGGLPVPGEALQYDIHIDGDARHGAVRVFFFHYDCRVEGRKRLVVREGQAGFFTDAELAESGGILWSPQSAEITATPRLDPPRVPVGARAFSAAEILAFAHGDGATTFGRGFERLATHVRTPRISAPPMLFWQEVPELDPKGGPWGRGYLRAEQRIQPDDWFFDGHFKNDPCMPGTLMFEGCLQALAFYMAALGFTLDKDGYRFEPVQGEPFALKCRGQVVPSSRRLTYEVFVEEVYDGQKPRVYADFLCTVDGLKAFHARRVGLELVPAWPLASRPEWLQGYVEPKVVAAPDGFPFGYASLMACAWGKPSEAFGPSYHVFDQGRSCARLPGPPYHFMSRITRIEGKQNSFQAGCLVELEYDIPPDAWYFDANGNRTMPFCVLLEAALQPCGWLACYVGSALTTDKDLYFRNLDGKGTLHAEFPPDAGTLRTVARLTNISNAGGMIIQSFQVVCSLGERKVYTLDTVFGFFPGPALANQVGMPPSAEERAALAEPSPVDIDLDARPDRYFAGPLALPDPMLLMIDRITGYWPDGGAHHLGRVRAVKTVDPHEWFFKAHFFSDPVQPGSLGLEAMIQALQWVAIERGLGEGLANPRFELLALERPLTWKYRGQVVPRNERVYVDLELTSFDPAARLLVADGYLWVDQLRIYQAIGMAIRVVDGPADWMRRPDRPHLDPLPLARPEVYRRRDLPRRGEAQGLFQVSVERDPWIGDHRPTWTLPALPATWLADAAAAALPGDGPVVEVRDFRLLRWARVEGPTWIRRRLLEDGQVQVEAGPGPEALEVAARGRFRRSETGAWLPRVAAWPVPEGLSPCPDPYASGSLFHGPAFQLLRVLRRGSAGAWGQLDAAADGVPEGEIRPGLLDAALHVLPHDAPEVWFPELAGQALYPASLTVRRFAAFPRTGLIEVVAHPGESTARTARSLLQLRFEGVVLAEIDLLEAALPKGPVGRAAAPDRRAFLRDGRADTGVALGRPDGEGWRVDRADVIGSDWLPGTVAQAYGLTGEVDWVEEVARREDAARQLGVHPRGVRLHPRGAGAFRLPLAWVSQEPPQVDASGVRIVSSLHPGLGLAPVRAWWDRWFQLGRWPIEDLYYGLCQRFFQQVVCVDPEALRAVHGQSTLFLGNHQTGVESLVFSILTSALCGVRTVTLAKAEHRNTWLGHLIAHSFLWPGARDPQVISFFQREDKESLTQILRDLAAQMTQGGKGVMVHVEGTRSLECRTPVQKMSGAFLDMAIAVDAPVVPVRFTGGLPTTALTKRIEFPLGFGQQTLWLGRPILPAELRGLPYKARKDLVIDAINALGPAAAEERPTAGDPAFAARVAAWQAARGVSEEHAVLWEVLRELPEVSPGSERLIAAVEGRQALTDSEEDRWLSVLADWMGG